MKGTRNEPWLDEVRNGKDGTENDTDTSNSHVGDTQEGVSSSHDSAGADQDGLGALILPCRED